MRPLTKRSFLIDVHYTHVSRIFPFSKKSDIVIVQVNVKGGLEKSTHDQWRYHPSKSRKLPFLGVKQLILSILR